VAEELLPAGVQTATGMEALLREKEKSI